MDRRDYACAHTDEDDNVSSDVPIHQIPGDTTPTLLWTSTAACAFIF